MKNPFAREKEAMTVAFAPQDKDGTWYCAATFKSSLPVGGSDLLAKVSGAFALSPKERFAVAEVLRGSISESVFPRSSITRDPIYNLVRVTPEERFSSSYGLVALVMLPSFVQPAHALYLVNDGEERLAVVELWYSADARLAPIDPGLFLQRYQIPYEDVFGFRAAVIDILNTRGAPRHPRLMPSHEDHLG